MPVFSYTCRDYVCGGFADVSMSGDDLVRVLSALGNAQRLRIMAALVPGRKYVSQMARDLKMSRPLLHLHLQCLEAAGLVTGTLELSPDGKAMKFYEVAPFSIEITPGSLARAGESLTSVSSEPIKGE